MVSIRGQAAKLATECFESAFEELKIPEERLWLGIYCALMWYEHGMPHIIDANVLKQQSIWQARARKVEEYLASNLNCSPEEVEGQLDRLMKTPNYEGKQRNNPLGVAFTALIRYLLVRSYNGKVIIEADPKEFWPGIRIPGRSTSPKIDILIAREELPICVISAKWSLRHDRLVDIIQECPSYKQSAYIVNRVKLKYYAITNEFNPARLSKIIEEDCIDGVIHVHKPLVTEILMLDGRLDKLMDLTRFLNNIDEFL
jgi:hypothetical protein